MHWHQPECINRIDKCGKPGWAKEEAKQQTSAYVGCSNHPTKEMLDKDRTCEGDNYNFKQKCVNAVATTIIHEITIGSVTKREYDNDEQMQSVFELAYAMSLGLYDSNTNALSSVNANGQPKKTKITVETTSSECEDCDAGLGVTLLFTAMIAYNPSLEDSAVQAARLLTTDPTAFITAKVQAEAAWQSISSAKADVVKGPPKYVGCFADKGDRDLPVDVGDKKTMEECAALCNDYKYFGRQWTRGCMCGNSYGKHGPRNDCQCEASNIGGDRNCIYEFEELPTPAPSPPPTVTSHDVKMKPYSPRVGGEAPHANPRVVAGERYPLATMAWGKMKYCRRSCFENAAGYDKDECAKVQCDRDGGPSGIPCPLSMLTNQDNAYTRRRASASLDTT